jgi:putative nucleotidyltransferase with HDIG domain
MAKKPDQRFSSMREFRDAVLLATSGAIPTAQQASNDSLAQVLTPSPVALSHISSATLSSAPTAYSPAPTPAPAPAPTHTPLPPLRMATVTSQPHPVPALPPPGLFPSTPAAGSSTLGSGKSALVDRIVEIALARTTPDAELDLPLVPRPILRCLDYLDAPDFSFSGMASLLATDARLSAQILQVANTSGPTRTMSRSTEQAVARLGTEGVRTGLYEIAVRPLIDTPSARLQAVCKQPWPHSLAVALLAQRLMHTKGGGEQALLEAYRCGLFHDSGKPTAANLLFDIERQLASVKGRKVLSDDMVTTCLDRVHAHVGARIARAWGLSPEESAAIVEAAQPASAPGFSLGATVRLANALAFKGGFHTRRDELDRSRLLVDEARRAAGFDEQTCHRVLEGCKDAISRRL